ncbi:Nuclear cap-binding protein subunit 2, partial [Dictyocoela roeselum]
YREMLSRSTTVYVGHIKSYVSEERIWALFGYCGEIRRVIMGVNRTTLFPCGFCFVEYYDRSSAEKAHNFIDGMKLDGKNMKVDIDYGFREGRQFGRGEFGGQLKQDLYKKRRLNG